MPRREALRLRAELIDSGLQEAGHAVSPDLLLRGYAGPRRGRAREEVDECAFASWSMAYLSPSAEEVAKWAELDGATTIGDILAFVESNPGRLPKMVVNILKTLAAP